MVAKGGGRALPPFEGFHASASAAYAIRYRKDILVFMKKSPQKAQSRKFILRPYRRIPTWYSSYYMSGELIGKGVVMNLSRTGMRMLGDHSISPGAELTVRLTVEENGPPLEISRASVRWANEYEFGLRIEQIAPTAAKRIVTLVNEQVRARRENS